MPRLAALVEQPPIRFTVRRVLTNVLGEDRDELVGQVDGALGLVLGCPDDHGDAADGLDEVLAGCDIGRPLPAGSVASPVACGRGSRCRQPHAECLAATQPGERAQCDVGGEAGPSTSGRPTGSAAFSSFATSALVGDRHRRLGPPLARAARRQRSGRSAMRRSATAARKTPRTIVNRVSIVVGARFAVMLLDPCLDV